MEHNCIICCDPIKIFGLGACNHRQVCHFCTFRLRILGSDTRCCICKTNLPTIVLTRDPSKKFDAYHLDTLFRDPTWHVYAEESQDLDDLGCLRDLNCPICPDKETFRSMKLLKHHLDKQHQLHYCDLCLEHRKVFLNEQKAYSWRDLQRHQKSGDPIPDAQSGLIKGHPLCEFCNKREYGDDELFTHMRTLHYTCHLCESEGRHFEYFADYPNLESHFRTDHYLCEDPLCLEKRFIVFKTEIDLKGHQRSTHLAQKNLSRSEIARASRVDISAIFFDSRQQQQQQPQRRPAGVRSTDIRFMNTASGSSSSGGRQPQQSQLSAPLSLPLPSSRSSMSPPPQTMLRPIGDDSFDQSAVLMDPRTSRPRHGPSAPPPPPKTQNAKEKQTDRKDKSGMGSGPSGGAGSAPKGGVERDVRMKPHPKTVGKIGAADPSTPEEDSLSKLQISEPPNNNKKQSKKEKKQELERIEPVPLGSGSSPLTTSPPPTTPVVMPVVPLPPPPAPLPDIDFYATFPKEEFERRNKELVGQMRQALASTPGRYEAFRAESVKLLKGEMTPSEYCRLFVATFGLQNATIFASLVTLLPDVEKKKSLFLAYMMLTSATGPAPTAPAAAQSPKSQTPSAPEKKKKGGEEKSSQSPKEQQPAAPVAPQQPKKEKKEKKKAVPLGDLHESLSSAAPVAPPATAWAKPAVPETPPPAAPAPKVVTPGSKQAPALNPFDFPSLSGGGPAFTPVQSQSKSKKGKGGASQPASVWAAAPNSVTGHASAKPQATIVSARGSSARGASTLKRPVIPGAVWADQ